MRAVCRGPSPADLETPVADALLQHRDQAPVRRKSPQVVCRPPGLARAGSKAGRRFCWGSLSMGGASPGGAPGRVVRDEIAAKVASSPSGRMGLFVRGVQNRWIPRRAANRAVSAATGQLNKPASCLTRCLRALLCLNFQVLFQAAGGSRGPGFCSCPPNPRISRRPPSARRCRD